VSLGRNLGIFAARSAALFFFIHGGGFTPGFDAKVAARGARLTTGGVSLGHTLGIFAARSAALFFYARRGF